MKASGSSSAKVCPRHPQGTHVFTSSIQVGDGPKQIMCSWCGRPQ